MAERGAAHYRLLAVVGGVLCLAASLGVIYPIWWNHRSSSDGQALLDRALHPSRAQLSRNLSACSKASSKSLEVGSSKGLKNGSLSSLISSKHPGVLEIPAIGLKAPVLQGVSDPVLNVAVGHYPNSPWPGASGESILLAHDVSYFSDINRLKPGNTVTWISRCEQVVLRVVASEVTQPGRPIPTPVGNHGLALITCWPTDALFWTSDRYVVETSVEAIRPVDNKAAPAVSPSLNLRVPAPAALSAEGLSPAKLGVLVGTLKVVGTASLGFREGKEPLQAAVSALRDYTAVARTALAHNEVWWSALALRGVPLPSFWSLRFDTNVTLLVNKNTVIGAILSSPATTVTLTVRNGTFFVSKVQR